MGVQVFGWYVCILFVTAITAVKAASIIIDKDGIEVNYKDEPQVSDIITPIVTLPIGVLLLLLGTRFVKVSLCVIGFLFPALYIYGILSEHADKLEPWACILLGIACGLLGLICSFLVYNIGLALSGFALGVVIAVLIVSPFAKELESVHIISIYVVVGLIFMALAVWNEQFMILVTATVGAVAICLSIDFIFFRHRFYSLLYNICMGKDTRIRAAILGDNVYIYVGSTIALIVVGAIVQHHFK